MGLGESRRSMIRFGIFGIPVTVRWGFWLMVALLSFWTLFSKAPTAPLVFASWTISVFVSILWHELGHAVLQRKYGQKSEIELYAFGGLAKGGGRMLTRTQTIIVCAAGPAAGLILGGLIWVGTLALVSAGVFPNSYFLATFISHMLWINIGWSIINLAPVLPLDGGQIMQAINGPQKMRQTLKVSVGAGIAMIFIALYFGLSILMMIFVFLTLQNYQAMQGLNRPMFGGGFPGMGGRPGRSPFG